MDEGREYEIRWEEEKQSKLVKKIKVRAASLLIEAIGFSHRVGDEGEDGLEEGSERSYIGGGKGRGGSIIAIL